jgi:hypothetical protein
VFFACQGGLSMVASSRILVSGFRELASGAVPQQALGIKAGLGIPGLRGSAHARAPQKSRFC